MGEDQGVNDQTLIVPARFCGPTNSGNGGWTAGNMATFIEECPEDHARVWPTIQVSLRTPPPLDRSMPVKIADGAVTVTHGAATVGIAACTEEDPAVVAPVSYSEAVEASETFTGYDSHPFARCFVCGPERPEGDGMRIFPGQVEPEESGGARVAAPWSPHPNLAEDFHVYNDEHARASLASTWAALDCIGGWAGGIGSQLMVLGRMVAQIDTLPVIGEPHVVVGESRGSEGRKNYTAATLYDSDGRVVGSAEHLWINVDRSAFA